MLVKCSTAELHPQLLVWIFSDRVSLEVANANMTGWHAQEMSKGHLWACL